MRLLLTCFVSVIFLTTAMSSECPKGDFCSDCNDVMHRIFEITCSLEDWPLPARFVAKFKPYQWINIICDEKSNWTDFHLGEKQQLTYVESMRFKQCGISDIKTLSQVVRQVVKQGVKELDFQSYLNQTTKFKREAFSNLESVESLILSNNYLNEVPVDLLHDLVNLKTLNISSNLLRELPTGFLDLPSLEYVYLSHNKLETLESGVFRRLSQLKVLDLEFNKLTRLAPTIFHNLGSLTNLNLGKNDLEALPDDIFDQLDALNAVHLSGNNFSTEGIPMNLFRNNGFLEIFSLSNNQRQIRTLPARMFAGLESLLAVDLDGNGIVQIPRDFLIGANNLKNLSLDNNKIADIPEELVKNCHGLELLSFRDNEITDLPSDMFTFLSKLEILDVGYNRLTEFNNKVLDGLTSLRIISLASNRIERIREDGQCASLNYFLNHNNLVAPGDGSLNSKNSRGMTYCPRSIEYVFLSDNRFETLGSGWLYSENLEILTLHNNRIKNITMHDLKYYSGDLQITYTGNQIETISLNEDDLRMRTSGLKLWLGSNPINCDCRLHDLLLHRDGQLNRGPLDLDMKKLTCAEPKELRGTRVQDLDRMALKCLVDDPSALNATCPQDCDCWTRPEDQGYLIDCSHRDLTEAPPCLQSPEGYHIELNLTGNQISQMPSMFQTGYEDVTALILSNNVISVVNLDSLSDNLEVLALDSNELTELDPAVLDFLTNSTKLSHLELHDNPWSCNCDTVDFLNFIQANAPNFATLQRVSCGSSDDPIVQVTQDDFCSPFLSSLVITGSILAMVGIFIAAIAILLYCYRYEIKIWLYTRQRCLWFVTLDEPNQDRFYDAFVSFSNADGDFIADTLVPTLEEGPNHFRICAQFSHWMPGVSVPSQILSAVEDSKRTIIVLSPHFLRNIWGSVGLKPVHQRILSEGRAIVILYGQIGSVDDLDPELKSYLKKNTCIKWGEPWFWEKLKYALPHRSDWERKRKLETVDLLDHRVLCMNNKNAAHSIPNV